VKRYARVGYVSGALTEEYQDTRQDKLNVNLMTNYKRNKVVRNQNVALKNPLKLV
jgi:hypothetical protein